MEYASIKLTEGIYNFCLQYFLVIFAYYFFIFLFPNTHHENMPI